MYTYRTPVNRLRFKKPLDTVHWVHQLYEISVLIEKLISVEDSFNHFLIAIITIELVRKDNIKIS